MLAVVMPDCDRDEPSTAREIALHVIDELLRRQPPLALFFLPNGRAKIIKANGIEFARMLHWNRLSLVGVYNNDARLENIIDDLLAMERMR
jgi:hypothetical protein